MISVVKVAFSTLAYPHLDLAKVLERANMFRADGVELRVSHDGVHLKPVYPVPRDVVDLVKSSGVKVCVVSGYARLSLVDPDLIGKSVELTKILIKISHKLEALGVRILANWSKNTREDHLAKLARVVEDLADFAEEHNTLLLFETHDDLAKLENLLHFLSTVDVRVGVVYDVANMLMLGEKHEEVFPRISIRVKHVHIKDYVISGGKVKYTKPGLGLVPICRVIRDLKSANYENYVSVEWEKMWHPDLEDSDSVIPLYIGYIRKCP